jgi:hypothetical protein
MPRFRSPLSPLSLSREKDMEGLPEKEEASAGAGAGPVPN